MALSKTKVVLSMLACILFIGCGPGLPRRAPTTGTVTVQGRPIAGAVVQFLCKGSPRISMGKTDTEGDFVLTTYEEGDGAVVGTNLVSVSVPYQGRLSSAPLPGAPGPASDRDIQLVSARARLKSAVQRHRSPIPAKYATPETSGLTFDVKAGEENHFEIQL